MSLKCQQCHSERKAVGHPDCSPALSRRVLRPWCRARVTLDQFRVWPTAGAAPYSKHPTHISIVEQQLYGPLFRPVGERHEGYDRLSTP
jgi:hypothetical protein